MGFRSLIDAYIEGQLIALPIIILLIGVVVTWTAITEKFPIYYLILGILLIIFPAYLILRRFRRK